MEQKWTNKLNNDEFNLIENDWYPLIKKSAMDKIKGQLMEEGTKLQATYAGESFKISAGDRLNNLPYMVLDFPKIASPQFNFVYRTLFWWGRGIQFQLILKEKPSDIYAQILSMAEPSDYILIGSNLWENDIETPHFKILSDLSDFQKEQVLNALFFKLVRFKPIEKNDNLFEGLGAFYKYFKEWVV